ncbi:hypothetical protein UFOVP653_24 [uncultured Caudovirales phage]|uniref:Uncharacterized protein n=1 Tax=uncultured Caudovirales phage TaxID=2100421 RepID=A0A6J5N9M4_9CAUD|nr:hypothetical protein UFOVP653_24 [uncultured Caudovirales phage]
MCERKYVTLENFVESVGRLPKAAPAAAPVKAAQQKVAKAAPPKVVTAAQRKTEVRRRLEDLRNRALEDDDF